MSSRKNDSGIQRVIFPVKKKGEGLKTFTLLFLYSPVLPEAVKLLIMYDKAPVKIKAESVSCIYAEEIIFYVDAGGFVFILPV